MNNYLLQIHIGPMQVFIAAARRTRDLWFSSRLMSELSKAAARGVAAQVGAEALIFPSVEMNALNRDSPLTVANKIVAVVSNKSPKEVAENARTAVFTELNTRIDDTFPATLQNKLTDWDAARAQIEDLPEFYWAAVPITDGYDGYQRARKICDNLLAARKNTRSFASTQQWAVDKPKSSLDGKRESVIPETKYPAWNEDLADRKKKIESLYQIYRARPAERLSGVDLLKRLGGLGSEDDFPSTSHMAAVPLRQSLESANGEVKRRWNVYFDKLSEKAPEVKRDARISTNLAHTVFGRADGSLLFESRLLDYFDKQIPEAVTNALSRFYQLEEVPNPIPYYALMVGDGDFIGRLINKLKNEKDHRHLSQTLAAFATEVEKIVEKTYAGAVIYAGGDDVVALLPLNQAIECANAVANAFRELKWGDQVSPEDIPTFSAGIAIVHHLEPLEDALNLARAAEKIAKSVEGKNALAISLDKRSGVVRTVVDHWTPLVNRLRKISNYYLKDLPHGLSYQLRDMALHLGDAADEKDQVAIQQIIALEAERIISRKEGSSQAKAYLKTEIEKLTPQKGVITSITNEIIIAGLLAQAKEQAGMTQKENTNGNLDN